MEKKFLRSLCSLLPCLFIKVKPGKTSLQYDVFRFDKLVAIADFDKNKKFKNLRAIDYLSSSETTYIVGKCYRIK